VEIGRIVVRSQPRGKVSETPISTNKSGIVGHFCNSSCGGGIDRGLGSRLALYKKCKTLSGKYLIQKVLGAWLKW
jgi:hypothetical protein